MVFVGVDWAEAHHDVCVLDNEGRVLGRRKVKDTLEGVRDLHALLATCTDDEADVVVGIEKDRGLIVTALVAAGYEVYAINPMAAAHYRDRHHVSGATSDPGDAKMLADLVRTDRHNPSRRRRHPARRSPQGSRAHQNAVWSRQRHVNELRSALRDYFPGALEAFGTDLAHHDALAVLNRAYAVSGQNSVEGETRECAQTRRSPTSTRSPCLGTPRDSATRAARPADDPRARLRANDVGHGHHHRGDERND